MAVPPEDRRLGLTWYIIPALWLAVALAGWLAVSAGLLDATPSPPPQGTPAPAAPAMDTAAETPDGMDAAEFADALRLYREGRWSAAYGRFSGLADRGHAGAARIALFMVRHGPELFDTPWSASEEQVHDWIFLAAMHADRRDLSGGD